MHILLFGKNGQVGWELQRALAPLGRITAVDFDSTDYCGDFSNPAGVADTVRLVKPDVIVNAAAHTAVDKAESEREFAELLTHALRQQGFVVTPLGNGPADFRIEKQGRITLVSAKRWKAATVGVDHLHELLTEAEAQDTKACSCISLGSFSPAAIKLAHDRQVQLLGAADIAQLMHDGSVA